MSIMYCYKHDISYDSDFVVMCSECENEEIEEDEN